MLVDQSIVDLLNKQIGNEFSASLQYVSIAAYFERRVLPELAAYFHTQSEEEHQHALKFVKYVGDIGAEVKIPGVKEPISDFKSVEAAVQLSYDQEVEVTNQIKAIYDAAQSQKDHVTESFLKWFLDEQLEEVASMDALLTIVRRAGDESNLFRVEEYVARQGHPEDAAK